MYKPLIILIIFNIYIPALSSIKDNVISQMQLTNNFSFDFIQTIADKSENGKCIIKYPKKIFCRYNGINKKIIVSNGRSLVIKTTNSKQYYIYPLKRTLLHYLLDKEYLISKIKTSELREIDDKYLNFEIIQDNNKINLFFDKKNLTLIGWQTEDIYQNLTITFISSVKLNQEINEKQFILPKKN
tara:strand:- start:329 stop:883 length:555 start_codon:yes stop_codon:yes gene_type:complete